VNIAAAALCLQFPNEEDGQDTHEAAVVKKTLEAFVIRRKVQALAAS